MEYSQKIAKGIETYLKKEKWDYEFDKKTGVFFSAIELECGLKTANVVLQVTGDAFISYCTIEINASPILYSQIGEYLHRANLGLINGNFEFDYDTGNISYKTYFDCPDENPTERQLDDAYVIPMTIVDKYGDGLLELVDGNESLAQKLVDRADRE